MKRILLLFLTIAMIAGSAVSVLAANQTPYTEELADSDFICGATFVLEKPADYEQWLASELQKARDIYHLNTVTVYGLEDYDDAYKAALFSQLKRLGMRVCIRIESYDADTFAFTKENAAEVMENYESLVAFTCQAEYRDTVYYYALNMPVDDPAVQENLGGVNSAMSKANQVTYAQELIRLMRQCTAENGYADAKLYLSVFYGWDGSYEVPSYASAGADGYFINNYTYPDSKELPGADTDPENILNTDRLSHIMELFLKDYPDRPPLMIECGFHTLEYNGGQWPGQTAGLVLDRQTKGVAMQTLVEYYRENYSFVEGMLYFGYNLFKEEGDPPTVMDWALQYPVEGFSEAENAGYEAGAMLQESGASEGAAVKLEAQKSISFTDCSMTQQAVLFYRADETVTLQLSSGGQMKKQIVVPASKSYTAFGVPLVLVDGYDLKITATHGTLYLDRILLLEQLEAEYALCNGTLQVIQELTASMETAAQHLVGRENALFFEGVRGGDTMDITYSAQKAVALKIVLDSGTYSVELPASNTLTTVSVSATVPKNGDFGLYEEGDSGFVLDCVSLSGVPGAEVEKEQNGSQEPSNTWIYIMIGAAAVIAVFAVGAVVIVTKGKKKSK